MKNVKLSGAGRGFAPPSFISGPFDIKFQALGKSVKDQIPSDVFALIENPESTSGATLCAREDDVATYIPLHGMIEFKIRTTEYDEENKAVIRKFRLSKRALLYVGNDKDVMWRDPVGK